MASSNPSRLRLLRPATANLVITLGLLLLTLGSSLWFQQTSDALALRRAPSALAANRAFAGVQRSLAALRGWVLVPNPGFKEERELAWREEIRPSYEELEALSVAWVDDHDRAVLREVRRLSADLWVSQWWVEEVAHTPGNEPGRHLYVNEMQPILADVLAGIDALVDAEQQRTGGARASRIAALGDLSRAVSDCDRVLAQEFLGAAGGKDLAAQTALVRTRFAAVRRATTDPAQRPIVEHVGRELGALGVLAEESTRGRAGQQTVAQLRLRDDTIPLASRVTVLLGELSAHHSARVRSEGARLVGLNRALVWVLSSLFVFIVVINLFSRLTQLQQEERALDGSGPTTAAPGLDLTSEESGPHATGPWARVMTVERRTPGAVRIGALWIILPVWLVGIVAAIRLPYASELLVAVGLAFAVGSLLNTLNWSSPSERAAMRLVWTLRFAGNYAVPFTVSLSSSLLASVA